MGNGEMKKWGNEEMGKWRQQRHCTMTEGSVTARLGVRDFEIRWISRGFRISEWISGFQSGFLDFKVDFWISKWISGFQSGFLDFSLDFWISDWISGFQIGFLDFRLDFWISQWISGFQFGFLPTVYEISFVTDPSTMTQLVSCKTGQ